jgi:UTP:GlnB (protein PII) uridylyltransferase
LLFAISQALFQQRVQIISSQVKSHGDRVRDRFHVVEFDNSPIGPNRRLEVQVAVLSVLDTVFGASVPEP